MTVVAHEKRNLISVPAFAIKKKVGRNAVYVHVRDGKIAVTLIGKDKDVYIDWDEYKNYDGFAPARRRN